MNRPEILAPGGSAESIYAALNAGCDAIYMGGKRYGARAFADNPDDSSLLEIIDEVHISGAKLYLTVNTILTEEEFGNLYKYIRMVYEHGVDAVIVQDMGVLRFIHREFPKLAIHASTQMNIVHASSANMLIPYGVTRIVPARELSLKELALFRKNSELELEVFVHGALCCSYSGQCLMSSLIGGRSGNRGACAQPCRKQYSYSGSRESFHLSLKDLCTLEYIPELVEAGVNSFKIEGRMKKPEYVALATHMYRKYLGYYYEKGFDGYKEIVLHSTEYADDIMHMKDIYNRGGFTAGYLIDDVIKDKMMTGNRSNHEGVIIGKIETTSCGGKNQAAIRFDEKVFAQDILEIRNLNGKTVHEHTLKEGAAKNQIIKINTGYNYNEIYDGCLVYRVRNNLLIDSIMEKYPAGKPDCHIEGCFTAKIGRPVQLKIWQAPSTEQGTVTEQLSSYEQLTSDEPTAAQELAVTVTGNEVSAASKHPASKEDVQSKVMLSGESVFIWDKLDIIMDEGIFLSPSELKSLRRKAFAELHERIASVHRRETPDAGEAEENITVSRVSRFDNIMHGYIAECRNEEQYLAVLKHSEYLSNKDMRKNQVISEVYLHIEDMEMSDVKRLLSLTSQSVFLVLPRLFREKNRQEFECRYDISELSCFESFKGLVVCNLEQIAWVNESFGGDIVMRSADNIYVRNSEAYKLLCELGVQGCQLSVEMTDREISEFPDCNAGLLVYGRASAMIMANHFGEDGELKDSYGNSYAVIEHPQTNYCEILHYEPFDRLDKYNANTVMRPLRLSFTTESSTEIQQILSRIG